MGGGLNRNRSTYSLYLHQFYYIWLDVIKLRYYSVRVLLSPDADFLPPANDKQVMRGCGFFCCRCCCSWWNGYGNDDDANLMKISSHQWSDPQPLFCDQPTRTVVLFPNTFARLFNLFIYESISNSFDYILFAPRTSVNICHKKWQHITFYLGAASGETSPQGTF